MVKKRDGLENWPKIKDDKKPFNKKAFLWIVLAIAVFCGLIYFIILLNTSYIELNSSSSKPVNVDSIVLNDEFQTQMNEKFADTETESIFCLYGQNKDGRLYIDNIKEGKIYFKSEKRIHGGCVKHRDYVGLIHSHPRGSCSLSDQDLFSFGITFSEDKTLILGVWCGEDNFSFYSSNSLKIPVNITYSV